ncbi:MAG: site-2 protease family protein [Thermoprotei archaeon]|nr:site-2 protease family protein [Thermoprotei archaeon]
MPDLVVSLIALALYWASFLAISFFLSKRIRGLRVNPLMIIYRKETTLETFGKASYNTVAKILLYAAIALNFASMLFFYYTIFGVVMARFVSPESAGGLVPIIPGITITGITIVYVLFSIGVSATIHELSHALASKIVGIPIKAVGFILSIFIPAAYVEPDEEKFNSADRLKKLEVLSAGPASNFIVGLIFLALLGIIASPMAGAMITSVDSGYPAEQYGLKPGWIIIAVNGTPIQAPGDLSPIISQYANSTVYFNMTLYDPKTNATFWKMVYKPDNFSRIGVVLEQARGPSPIPDSIYYPLLNLLFYLYIINISLALINSAPIFITDGGKVVSEIIGWKIKGNAGKALNFFIQVFTLLLVLSSITFTPI